MPSYTREIGILLDREFDVEGNARFSLEHIRLNKSVSQIFSS